MKLFTQTEGRNLTNFWTNHIVKFFLTRMRCHFNYFRVETFPLSVAQYGTQKVSNHYRSNIDTRFMDYVTRMRLQWTSYLRTYMTGVTWAPDSNLKGEFVSKSACDCGLIERWWQGSHNKYTLVYLQCQIFKECGLVKSVSKNSVVKINGSALISHIWKQFTAKIFHMKG
jgi:hypothetical protein